VSSLAPLLQAFFGERLLRQRRASPHTIAAYRDTFRMLLGFAERRIAKSPMTLVVADLDATLVGAFLDHLERDRNNGARTRNGRLAAIRSFFRFLAVQEPTQAGTIQRVMAIPQKRFDRNLVGFLERVELDAVLAAPDRSSRHGRRDYVLLLVAAQTGLRVAELTGLRTRDVVFETTAYVRCHGKGRKERSTPLTKPVATTLRAWIRENELDADTFIFQGRHGQPLSRDTVAYIVAKHVGVAAQACPSLRRKRVTPHVLRHTTAVHLLQAGVDRAIIALWLGHESVETTQIYLDADLAMKDRALARTAPLGTRGSRFRPKDSLLTFLEGL
jgi:site-specific recombinase XerD